MIILLLQLIGTVFLILVPGILLTFSLFPKKMDWEERVLIGLLLGVPTFSFVMMCLNLFFGIRLTQTNLFIVLILFMVVCYSIYKYRRRK